MRDIILFLNKNAHMFGLTAIALLIVSVIILIYCLNMLGKNDERARAIKAELFKGMFFILVLAMGTFYTTVPNILHSMHQWFPVFTCLAFIWGAIWITGESKI
jgi:Na+/citrate or Na+/malate symporter